jgi:excisionase family DNA binding protein
MERRFLSIQEAAKYSSLSTRFLYEKCQNRELRFSKVGKRIVIDSQDLHDFIIQNTVEPVEDWSEKLGLK